MAARWADNLLQNSLGLRPGESVLVLADEPLRQAGETLLAAAKSMGAARAAAFWLPPSARSSARGPQLAVVPTRLSEQVRAADVILSLISDLDLSAESPLWRAAVAAFRSTARGRWAFGAFVDDDLLAQESATDHAAVAHITEALAARLERVGEVRVTSSAGTDLRLRLDNRPVHAETGVLSLPGSLVNFPAGEAFVAPLEESAEGRLVVDLCIGEMAPDCPVTLTFRHGRVVDIEGEATARELRRRLGDDPWAWTIGEFGMGTNPYARIRGRAITDEKVLGTIHVALGANQQFGGINPAVTHYDCVLRSPQVYLDGTLVRAATG